MSVSKKTNKNGTISWEYRLELARIDGKRNRLIKGGFKSKKEAEKAYNEAYEQYHNKGVVAKKSTLSYADFSQIWIDKYCKNNLKIVTTANYTKLLKNQINPRIGDMFINEISKETLQDLINKAFHSGISINTLTEIRGILTKSLRYAEDNKYILLSPANGLTIPKNVKPMNPTVSHDHIYLEVEEMKKIFEILKHNKQHYLPVRLGYECGLRHAEIFALVWEDIDLEHKVIHINRQIEWSQDSTRTYEDKKSKNGSKERGNAYLYYKAPKYNSYRTIEISDELCEILKREKVQQEKDAEDYAELYVKMYTESKISSNINKEAVDTIENKITTTATAYEIHPVLRKPCGEIINPRISMYITQLIKDKVNKDFTFHSLRHSHTTLLLMDGQPIKYVSARLGHKSVEITLDIYTHLPMQLKTDEQKEMTRLFSLDSHPDNVISDDSHSEDDI